MKPPPQLKLNRRPARPRAARRATGVTLDTPGWTDPARRSLERLIKQGAGRHLPVVFDFDNTIIGGDIGEAALAVLAAEGRLTPATVAESLCPVLQPPGREKIEITNCSNIMEYYEAFLAPTVHGPADPYPLANGYVWATEIMEDLTIAEVVAATAKAFTSGNQAEDAQIEVTPGRPGYPAPRFHPQIVELIGCLLRAEFDVWIVSASNVWSVRWMAAHGLNPLLKQLGFARGLQPNRVLGLATLLKDSNGFLYKDAVLVHEDKAYAALDPARTSALRLTRRLEFPAPVYSGKVARILDTIGANPYLCAGDSISDHPMMSISQHRLWIARLDKPEPQRATRALIRQTGAAGWIVQGCCPRGPARFLPTLDGLSAAPAATSAWRESARILQRIERDLSLAGNRRSKPALRP
jgi:phosphoserine phosphatase